MASTSSISSTSSATLSVAGLATGMDTSSIVDKLVQIESIPLTNLQNQQSAYNTQISLLGDLASRLNDLKSAAAGLGSSGVMALQATSSNTSFSASPGSGATAGSYSVQVGALATAAKWRSGGLGSADSLQPGTLSLTVGGTTYPAITIDSSTTLDSLAASVRATGAPVSVNILNDGTDDYLSITNLYTGYTGNQADALNVSFTPADPQEPESFFSAPTLNQQATNASFTVDGLTFTRPSNTVADAIPGTTLTLKSPGGPAELLSIGYDQSGTQANLQKFVDSYNGLMSAIQTQLNVSPTTDRTTTLAGDSVVQGLQQTLQSLTSSLASSKGTVHSLADLGIKTNKDGTLSLDSSVLSSAIASDPAGVDAVFSDATTGIALQLSTIATNYSSVTGLLSTEQTTLQSRVSSISDQAAQLQARINAYHDQLVAQFAAMENIVSSWKSIGDFLTQQANASSSK